MLALQIEGSQPQSEPRDTYEAAVKKIRKFAILTCIRVKVTCFLGLCTLTWATTVFLGGLVTKLLTKQFMGCAVLLMAQAVQFGAIVSWRGFLPDTSLLCRSAQSSIHSTSRFWFLGLLECLYLFTFYAIYLWALPINSNEADGLTRLSIFIFILLGQGTAVTTFYGLIIQVSIRRFSRWPCLSRYYDRLVWVGLTLGLKGLAQLEVVNAVFEMMSQEFRKGGCKYEEVFIVYERMIEYVYRHDGGLEAALAAMESSDRYVQEAAVHMVGLWAFHYERGPSHKKLRFENALLRRLVCLCTSSAGPIGSKAARSIEMVAKEDPEGLIKAGEASQVLVQMLVRRVVELVDLLRLDPLLNKRAHDSMPHLYESLLHSCKALVWLLICDKDCFCECLTNEQQARLAERLVGIFRSSHTSWKRMQVVAGHALHLLQDPTSLLTEAMVFQHLKAETAAPTSSFLLLDEEHAWFINLVGGDASLVAWNISAFLKVSSRDDMYGDASNALSIPSTTLQLRIKIFEIFEIYRYIVLFFVFVNSQWSSSGTYKGAYTPFLVALSIVACSCKKIVV